MKVVLQQDVKSLGKKGTVVDVKDGFARNFLLPQKKALRATSANLETIEKRLKLSAQASEEDKKKAEDFAKKLSSLSCTVSVDVHGDDELYGSVTAAHIASALEADGVVLEKKQIVLDEPIKKLGIYDIEVDLHPEVKAKLKVWVVKNNG